MAPKCHLTVLGFKSAAPEDRSRNKIGQGGGNDTSLGVSSRLHQALEKPDAGGQSKQDNIRLRQSRAKRRTPAATTASFPPGENCGGHCTSRNQWCVRCKPWGVAWPWQAIAAPREDKQTLRIWGSVGEDGFFVHVTFPFSPPHHIRPLRIFLLASKSLPQN